MATRSRGMALIGCLLLTGLGCDSAEESALKPASASEAGRAAATAGMAALGGRGGGGGMSGMAAFAGTLATAGGGGVLANAGGAGVLANAGGAGVLAGRGGGAGAGVAPVPPRWTCDASLYGDGRCNCGCGVIDVDCPDASVASCQECDRSSCSPFACEVEPSDNAHCLNPPFTWNCSPRLYRDGSRCDCGCGAIDPDCEASEADACDKCDAPGSCTQQACPGLINAEFNGECDQPPPPPEWTCDPGAYADGIACDCGCSAPDPDCRNADFSNCVRCLNCGGHGVCEGYVEPESTTQCAPPKSGWSCSAEAYRDSICDCGCGIPDIYCQGIELRYVCGNYPVEGCSGGNRSHIDPNHNALCNVTVPEEWTCEQSYYQDGLCDCGCGALDTDCAADDVENCEKCDNDGGCGVTECPGTIVADDTAHCSN